MDIHSIKSDLIAMEMEMNYHDGNDDNLFDFDRKTPKTSHATYQADETNKIKEESNQKKGTSQMSKYISLAWIGTSKSVRVR